MKPLFTQGPSATVRLVLLATVSILLMSLDHREHLVEPVRETVSGVVYPLRFVVDAPFSIAERVSERLATRHQIMEENRQLRDRHLEYQERLQRMHSLERENERLRDLLGSSERLETEVAIAQLMRVELDPHTHLVEIDRGSRQGVFVGQPVLDANGVMGQVDRVGAHSASVRLISDPSHAIPVENNRNGLRTVALGSGDPQRLELANVPGNADLREGDLLTASGLGGAFPRGYPVAEVTSVEVEAGEPFARVTARPAAELDRSRKLLLVSVAENADDQAGDDEAADNESEDAS
ncbi:rod shape-determining protein MreC [Halorhodospira halophila]|uniref:rod shape-determining protein MreC n=1 Tax=Halorhodospira halophila TaxID=1053 RepID=UPI0009D720EB|nr:rod shape-determining protein MreC [Halorhodospira halophila]MBK1728889.1 rod shape-determining protein MreC [Halorhodospira halophila]